MAEDFSEGNVEKKALSAFSFQLSVKAFSPNPGAVIELPIRELQRI